MKFKKKLIKFVSILSILVISLSCFCLTSSAAETSESKPYYVYSTYNDFLTFESSSFFVTHPNGTRLMNTAMKIEEYNPYNMPYDNIRISNFAWDENVSPHIGSHMVHFSLPEYSPVTGDVLVLKFRFYCQFFNVADLPLDVTVGFYNFTQDKFLVEFDTAELQSDHARSMRYFDIDFRYTFNNESVELFKTSYFTFSFGYQKNDLYVRDNYYWELYRNYYLEDNYFYLGDGANAPMYSKLDSSKFDEYNKMEEQLNENINTDIDFSGGVQNTLTNLSDGMRAVTLIMNRFISGIPFISDIVSFSLALGLFAFLFALISSAVSKSAQVERREQRNNRNNKGGG